MHGERLGTAGREVCEQVTEECSSAANARKHGNASSEVVCNVNGCLDLVSG
jgi:hypothetical protein